MELKRRILINLWNENIFIDIDFTNKGIVYCLIPIFGLILFNNLVYHTFKLSSSRHHTFPSPLPLILWSIFFSIFIILSYTI